MYACMGINLVKDQQYDDGAEDCKRNIIFWTVRQEGEKKRRYYGQRMGPKHKHKMQYESREISQKGLFLAISQLPVFSFFTWRHLKKNPA